MALSTSILPKTKKRKRSEQELTEQVAEKTIQTEPLAGVAQDLILDYVADGIAESKSIYTAENRCTLFEGGTREKPIDKLVLHVALHNLLRHVVSGEQAKAQAIIEAHPEFLFKSGSVNDLSGNTFVSFSPVELARFAHDVEMLEMMKLYADKIEGAIEKFVAIHKQATAYEEAKKQDVYDFSGIIAAITGNSKEVRTDALNKFRQTFAPRVIENSEKSYSIENLRKAYVVHVSHDDSWSVDRRQLFWCQVIGYLQRSLPACYAQAYCQGLYNVATGLVPLKRRLKLYSGENFYPSDLSVSCGLGFDFGIYSARGVTTYEWGPDVPQRSLSGPAPRIGSLYQAKTTALRELMQLPSNRAESGFCPIM